MDEYIDREQALSALCNNSIPVFDGDGHTSFVGDYIAALNSVPAADVVEVVRCKDCYYWTRDEDKTDGFCLCDRRTNLIEAINLMAPYTTENDYCSWGERKEGEG